MRGVQRLGWSAGFGLLSGVTILSSHQGDGLSVAQSIVDSIGAALVFGGIAYSVASIYANLRRGQGLAKDSGATSKSTASSGPSFTFNGPVHGLQQAWANSGAVHQVQGVSAGYEQVAAILDGLAATLPVNLGRRERRMVEEAVEQVNREIRQANPDEGVLSRAFAAIKGVLAPVALGVSQGVTAESAAIAKRLIEEITRLKLG